MKISKYAKAAVAAVAAGSAALSTAVQDNVITGAEWWTAGVAVLAALGFTWAIPNKPTEPKEPTA